MARLRFKRFSDLAFIQSIDKPQHLAPLLAPHAEYFARQGVDVDGLKNGDGTDRELLRVFTQSGEDMPAELLDALYTIDDLADEAGHDRILDEARRQGIKVDGDGLTPGEFAIAVHRQHPGLVLVCYDATLYRKVRNYQEYQAKNGERLDLATAQMKVKEIEEALGPWFESRNRSRACEIYVYEEDGEVKFLITHGRILRTEGSIDRQLKRSRVAYRPQKHDSVIYDSRLQVLKINAQTLGERDLYRQTFGRVLFGGPDYFTAGDVYTLAPLKRGSDALRTVAGVVSVRLLEVSIETDSEPRLLQTSRSHNLIESIGKSGRPNLADGRIVRAAFLIKYSSGGRPRRLELRPPNVAIYDRDRDGAAAEAFLRANGYLKIGASADARP